MRWIGLTGGIACGKSTVSEILRFRGWTVIDADVLAREVVRQGTKAHSEIVQIFGADSVAEDGELNRAKVGAVVFSDRSKLTQLESIIHPLVRARTMELKLELAASKLAAAFYDVPLLFEKKMQDQFDLVIVVTCRAEIQLQRLMARNGLAESEALKRVASQLPLVTKEAGAQKVIHNDRDRFSLEQEVERVLSELGLSHHGQT